MRCGASTWRMLILSRKAPSAKMTLLLPSSDHIKVDLREFKTSGCFMPDEPANPRLVSFFVPHNSIACQSILSWRKQSSCLRTSTAITMQRTLDCISAKTIALSTTPNPNPIPPISQTQTNPSARTKITRNNAFFPQPPQAPHLHQVDSHIQGSFYNCSMLFPQRVSSP